MSETKLKMAAQTGGRILVVDDEEKCRRFLVDLLSAEGYTVQAAVDGMEALQRVAEFKPEVILLDVMMPKLDGIETCRRLKTDPVTDSIPVLLTTALHERANRLRGIQAGANDFLTKPIDPEEIRLRVKNAVYAKQLYDHIRDAYAQLQALQELQDNLTQFIVHDLRSPLAVIIGNLELLKLGFLGPLKEKQLANVDDAFYIAQQLIEMISSLLDVTRLEKDRMPLRLEPCELPHLVRESLANLGSLLGSARVSVDMPPGLPPVVCDGAVIQRVLVNLLGNASKYVSTGGEIRITIAPNEGDWIIRVMDTGPGIPTQYQDRIFEKFGQVDAQSGARKYSTGLGLTFCKLAVEAHGGRVGVDSREGQGSTFWFTLPARKTETTRAEDKR
jgi:two-component system sensor histidine kinase/response regulator